MKKEKTMTTSKKAVFGLIACILMMQGMAYGQGTRVEKDAMIYTNTATFSNTVTIGISGNKMTVRSDGIMIFSGNAALWDDMMNPANTFFISGTADITNNSPSNAIVFATTATTNLTTGDHLWAVIQVPHMWKTNTDISPHIHFYQNSADQTNCWVLRYKWYNIGDAVPGTWSEMLVSSNMMPYTSGFVHQIADFTSDMNSAGKNISSIIDVKIFRKGNVGTGPVLFKQFDMHYQRDSLGSDNEFSKTF